MNDNIGILEWRIKENTEESGYGSWLIMRSSQIMIMDHGPRSNVKILHLRSRPWYGLGDGPMNSDLRNVIKNQIKLRLINTKPFYFFQSVDNFVFKRKFYYVLIISHHTN